MKRPPEMWSRVTAAFGGDGWMPVVHAVDHAPETQALGGLGQCGQHRPALQMGSVERGTERVEVVHRPRRLEQLDVVGGAPHVEEVGPRAMLGRCLDAVCDHSQNLEGAAPKATSVGPVER